MAAVMAVQRPAVLGTDESAQGLQHVPTLLHSEATHTPAAATDSDADSASRHIREPEHPAAFWQSRLSGSADIDGVAERSAARWLDGHQRLVVVAPHPDDEVLMCSGLMQLQQRRGGEVLVIALTDGEACFGADAERAAIALERRSEALSGLQALGVGAADVQYFGLPDGALALHESAVEQRLLDLLRPSDLVVCTWRSDGHPDHEAAGRASALACAAHGATLLEAPVWMWHWARPEHPAIDWRCLVRMPLDPAEVHLKWQALQCHPSQLTPRGAQPPVVDAGLQERVWWPFETFFENASPT